MRPLPITLRMGLWPLACAGGFTGLVLQVAWFHQLRFILGSSTSAMALGIAVFMGGLSLGNLWLGGRAEKASHPLRFYALLESGVAVSSFISPLLLSHAQRLEPDCSLFGLRLFIWVFGMGVPVLLMGGTIPALARAVVVADAGDRRAFAGLYGINTLGAALGAVVASICLLPLFGACRTVWIASLVSASQAVLARSWSDSDDVRLIGGEPRNRDDAGSVEREVTAGIPHRYWISAFLLGFSFFLMEVVWYRLLGPLLGGTVQAFGFLLAAILIGVGGGAILLSVLLRGGISRNRMFVAICFLTAFAMAFPFALGDQVALWSIPTFSASSEGGWLPPGALIALACVVVPGASLGGLLLPLLVDLAGRGAPGLASHAGILLGSNTLGGMLGSIIGGVILLPWLGLTGCWMLAGGLFALVGILCCQDVLPRFGWKLLLPLAACFLPFLATGPTAFWRHCYPEQTARMIKGRSPSQIRDVMATSRRRIIWEKEGCETALALSNAGGLTLLTNGNGEGNVTQDQAMLISLGLVGSARHPNPRSALVIGLGTGCTAGWLAEIPGMERVDVFELEPHLAEMASRCAAINHDVLNHPKVRLRFGDGRQLLQTATGSYDLIVSAPSNLFRVGMAGLYSQDFFRVVSRRLQPGGLFGLWVQMYGIDREAFEIVIRTLRTVFPHVEGWLVDSKHLLLLASEKEPAWDLPRLQARLVQPFWQHALWSAWRTRTLEGFLARSLGTDLLGLNSRTVEPGGGVVNTDDHLVLEYHMGRLAGHSPAEPLAELVQDRGGRHPNDWAPFVQEERLILERVLCCAPVRGGKRFEVFSSGDGQKWQQAIEAAAAGRAPEAISGWPPVGLSPLADLFFADVYSQTGDRRALELAAKASELMPAEAGWIETRFLYQTGERQKAAERLIAVFALLGKPPQALPTMALQALQMAPRLAAEFPALAPRLFEALRTPFFLDAWNDHRLLTRVDLGLKVGPQAAAEAFRAFEPHIPWNEEFLQLRAKAYEAARDVLAARAAEELRQFRLY